MRLFKFYLIAIFFFALSGKCLAQKSGYINVDDVVRLMPELQQVSADLQHYQTDSLQREFNTRMEKYKFEDSMMNKTDTTKIPVATRAQYRIDLQVLVYQLQNWQSLAQQAVDGRRQQLLDPLYRKAYAAIQSVSKEKGYPFVFTKDAIIIGPPGDDLLPLVAAKLGIKLPDNTTQKKPTGQKH